MPHYRSRSAICRQTLKACRASSFQSAPCFTQTCRTPIFETFHLPSPLPLSPSQAWRTMALLPTTATVCLVSSIRLVDRLLAGDHVDEHRLVLERAARMAVAQLVDDQRLELGPVGGEHGLGEVGDRVGDGGGVGRLGKSRVYARGRDAPDANNAAAAI